MSFHTITAASLALGASVMSMAAPAVRADVYDSFGFYGNCDSGSVAVRGPNGEALEAGGRDCRKARKWASKEASRNRRHETQSQLLGLGGNLVTGLILNSQQQKQQAAEPTGPSEAELALLKQPQELEFPGAAAGSASTTGLRPFAVTYIPGHSHPWPIRMGCRPTAPPARCTPLTSGKTAALAGQLPDSNQRHNIAPIRDEVANKLIHSTPPAHQLAGIQPRCCRRSTHSLNPAAPQQRCNFGTEDTTFIQFSAVNNKEPRPRPIQHKATTRSPA